MSKNRKLTEFFISSATLRAKRPLPADDDQASVKDCSDVWRISPSATRKEVEAISRPPAVATHDSIQTHHSSTLVAIMDPSGDPQPSLPNPSHVNPALSTVQTNSCKDRKRMMKDGEVVIRSSDDEDSASDSSLVDVDNLLIAQRPTLKPSLLKGAADDIIPPLDRLANPKSIRITSRKPAKPRQPTSSSPMPLMPKYKYSLDSLVNQAERDTASEVDVERARSRIESSDCAGGEPTGSGQANFVVASTGSTSDQLDESLLASVIPASGEGAAFSKVLQAMKRTEALHRGKIWAFFSSGQPRSICDLRPFPVHAFPLPGWQDLLKGQSY